MKREGSEGPWPKFNLPEQHMISSHDREYLYTPEDRYTQGQWQDARPRQQAPYGYRSDVDEGLASSRRPRQRHLSPRRATRARSPSRESVPRYNGKFEFANFKLQFDCMAEDHGWSYIEMGKKLNRCLVDEARGVLGTLHSGDATDYHALCKALDSLHSTPGGKALIQAQLHRILRPAGQSAAAFGREVKRLGKKAYPQGNDEALIASFIRGLNDDELRKYVQLQMPASLDDAIEQACIYQAVDGEYGASAVRKPKLVAAAKSEEPAKTPWEQRIGELEKKLDSVLKLLDTPADKPNPQTGRFNSQVECWVCHQKGHIAPVCPQRQDMRSSARFVGTTPEDAPPP
jgi:hypothetical protein